MSNKLACHSPKLHQLYNFQTRHLRSKTTKRTSQMKRILIIAVLNVATVLFPSCATGGEKSASPSAPRMAATSSPTDDVEPYTHFSESVFSLKVPRTWKRMAGADLDIFKKEYEAQSKQMFEDYHGPNVKDETGVPYMFVFSAPQMEALLVGVVMNMPPQKKSYLDETYDRSKDIIQYGIRQGVVRRLLENKKDFSHEVPALKTDLEMKDGRRMTSYAFYSADHPNLMVYFVARFKLEVFSKYEQDLNHVVNSLRIRFN